MKELDIHLLRRLLDYNPETGKLFWKRRPLEMFDDERLWKSFNAQFAGAEAFTCADRKGHLCGKIFGKSYFAHRVIWALVKGYWPERLIDHKDRDHSNNKWGNLREATHKQNSANSSSAKGSSSKYLGVSWDKKAGKWRARIRAEGVKESLYLGHFTDELEAAKAYDKAAKSHHGEFANLNFEEAMT